MEFADFANISLPAERRKLRVDLHYRHTFSCEVVRNSVLEDLNGVFCKTGVQW
jgi:hypothetical protein